jgi:hypothetical protein
MRRRDGEAPRVALTAATPLDEWRAQFAATDDPYERRRIRCKLVPLVAKERDAARRAAMKAMLEEMRMCR